MQAIQDIQELFKKEHEEFWWDQVVKDALKTFIHEWQTRNINNHAITEWTLYHDQECNTLATIGHFQAQLDECEGDFEKEVRLFKKP